MISSHLESQECKTVKNYENLNISFPYKIFGIIARYAFLNSIKSM